MGMVRDDVRCYSVSMAPEDVRLARELVADGIARVLREAVVDGDEGLRARMDGLSRLAVALRCAEAMW